MSITLKREFFFVFFFPEKGGKCKVRSFTSFRGLVKFMKFPVKLHEVLEFHELHFTNDETSLHDWVFLWHDVPHARQHPTSNLVMSQLYQKVFSPEMMKGILNTTTQMVERMYRYFDSNLSESRRVKLYIFTLLDPKFKNYNMSSTLKYV